MTPQDTNLIAPPDTLVAGAQNLSETVIDQSVAQSVQSRSSIEGRSSGLFGVLRGGVQTGLYIPPWWSPRRDRELRNFWKKSDYIAGAVYTMEVRMQAITKRVVPVNPNIREHQIQAEEYTELLDQTPEFGEGWETFYGKFVEELLTQDNGVFVEVIGEGPSDGPIIGMPISVAILDSRHCQRTGDSQYPVIFYDESGKPHKMHRSRVMFISQMSSPDRNMLGVGFCAVSRVINVAQTLLDILVYKQEKLGSRPHQAILVTRGGLDPNDVANAFAVAESNLDSQGLTRYSKVVLTGNSTIMDADIKEVDLNNLPEWFDEYNSITLGIAAVALGFGVDARELFPALGQGATRADAMLSHLKQRGKSPGQIIDLTEKLFNQKFLPRHLKLTFDFQDDAQDRQSAEIRKIRQEGWNYAINSGVINDRIIREQMLASGDLDRAQFERLELQDGRLPDGSPINALFYAENPLLQTYLKFPGVTDPCDVYTNEPEKMLKQIAKNQMLANTDLINTSNAVMRYYAETSLYALQFLKDQYTQAQVEKEQEEQQEQVINQEQNRTRSSNILEPNDNSASPSGMDQHDTSPDDEE